MTDPNATRTSTLIVLLMPELIAGTYDVAALHQALKCPGQKVRVLIRVANPDQFWFAETFARVAPDTELLLAHGVPEPSGSVVFARLPQGGKPDDIDEFAFALSDVVVADVTPDMQRAATAPEMESRLQRARQLGKTVIKPGDPLTPLPETPSIASGLDPDGGGWHFWGRRVFGRLEQAIVELAAFDLFDYYPKGCARSCERLGRCVGLNWRPEAYFAPKRCLAFAPDDAVVKSGSPLVQRFEMLDRSAFHGSHIHRDVAWMVHLFAACAVLAAVAGLVYDEHRVSPWVEFGLLSTILGTLFLTRHFDLHGRWIACRMAAEQLRIARMCLPLMVVPPALITVDTPPEREDGRSDANDLTFLALSEVKRVLRDQGLPRKGCGALAGTAVQWLECIVKDQIVYHQGNYRRLERAESALQWVSILLFVAILVVVGREMLPEGAPSGDHRRLFLLTAAGPALAAALHGATTRLGIVHRIDLSKAAERELGPIHRELALIAAQPSITEAMWVEVRDLAYRAADVMGQENTDWQGLLRLQRDALPA